MQIDKVKKREKIHSAFGSLDKKTKAALNIGTLLSLLVLVAGTVLLTLNQTVFNYDIYIKFISTSIIKAGFTILAEVIIGGLLMDYIFNNSKNNNKD